jgi:hypothetical protein
MVLKEGTTTMAETKRTTTLRMAWDASLVEVESIRHAIRKARQLGLGWFDLQEWQYRNEKGSWVTLGTWAKDANDKFVSIPASEGNE